jgi:hypothetical protein
MRCSAHGEREATRQCTRCQRLFCDGCVKRVKAGTGVLESCPVCSGLLKVAAITVPPLRAQLADVLARPFSKEGLVTALALAFAYWLSVWLPIVGPLFLYGYLAGLVAYYFQIIDHVGRDRAGLPGPADTVEDVPHVLGLLLRGFICALLGTVPLLLWLHLARHDAPTDPRTLFATVLGLLLVGQIYMPAALLAIVLTDSTLGALYPVAWLRIIARAPASYAQLVVLYIASILVGGAIWIGGGLVLDRLPLVGGLLTAMVHNLLLFSQAALVGGFLRRNADELGYD